MRPADHQRPNDRRRARHGEPLRVTGRTTSVEVTAYGPSITSCPNGYHKPAPRRWGELGKHVPDACVNIVANPKKPVALSRRRRTRTLGRGARQPSRRSFLAGGGASPDRADRRAALGSPHPEMARDRRVVRKRRQRDPHREHQDRAAHDLARAGSRKAGRRAAPAGRSGAGVSRRPHIESPLHLLGAASGSKPGYPAFASTTAATPGPRGTS